MWSFDNSNVWKSMQYVDRAIYRWTSKFPYFFWRCFFYTDRWTRGRNRRLHHKRRQSRLEIPPNGQLLPWNTNILSHHTRVYSIIYLLEVLWPSRTCRWCSTNESLKSETLSRIRELLFEHRAIHRPRKLLLSDERPFDAEWKIKRFYGIVAGKTGTPSSGRTVEQ